MATAQEIAAFVGKRRMQPPSFLVVPELGMNLDFLGWGTPKPVVDPMEELAQQLYSDAEWKALRLATFMNAPDGKLIAEGVGTVIGFQPEYDLWVKAMQRAAQMQYTEGSKPAGRLALAATAVFIVIAGVAVMGRQ
jgi:hypothetical protein